MAYIILINGNSGTVKNYGAEKLESAIRALTGDHAQILITDAPGCTAQLNNLTAKDTILIGGGDGTIRSAARLLHKRNIPFGIIPLGTMNLLAKDLGLPLDPLEAIRQYHSHREIRIDHGVINGEIFTCNAMIGITTAIARQRERKRDQPGPFKWLSLLRTTLKKLGDRHNLALSLRSDNLKKRLTVKAAIIANNEYDEQPGIASFHKKSLTDGKLSIYAVRSTGTLESIALLSKIALGNWQNDPAIEKFQTRKLRINNYRRTIPVLIDGELQNMRLPLYFHIEPESLRLLIPAAAEVP